MKNKYLNKINFSIVIVLLITITLTILNFRNGYHPKNIPILSSLYIIYVTYGFATWFVSKLMEKEISQNGLNFFPIFIYKSLLNGLLFILFSIFMLIPLSKITYIAMTAFIVTIIETLLLKYSDFLFNDNKLDDNTKNLKLYDKILFNNMIHGIAFPLLMFLLFPIRKFLTDVMDMFNKFTEKTPKEIFGEEWFK